MYMRNMTPNSRTRSINSHGRRAALTVFRTVCPPGTSVDGIDTSGNGADIAAAASRRSLMSPTTISASSDKVCRSSATSPSTRCMRSARSPVSASADDGCRSSRRAGVLMPPFPAARVVGRATGPLPSYSSRYRGLSSPTSRPFGRRGTSTRYLERISRRCSGWTKVARTLRVRAVRTRSVRTTMGRSTDFKPDLVPPRRSGEELGGEGFGRRGSRPGKTRAAQRQSRAALQRIRRTPTGTARMDQSSPHTPCAGGPHTECADYDGPLDGLEARSSSPSPKRRGVRGRGLRAPGLAPGKNQSGPATEQGRTPKNPQNPDGHRSGLGPLECGPALSLGRSGLGRWGPPVRPAATASRGPRPLPPASFSEAERGETILAAREEMIGEQSNAIGPADLRRARTKCDGRGYLIFSMNAFRARARTLAVAGLSLDTPISPVNGLRTGLPPLTAGFGTALILAMPGSVRTRLPFLPSCRTNRFSRAAKNFRTSAFENSVSFATVS